MTVAARFFSLILCYQLQTLRTCMFASAPRCHVQGVAVTQGEGAQTLQQAAKATYACTCTGRPTFSPQISNFVEVAFLSSGVVKRAFTTRMSVCPCVCGYVCLSLTPDTPNCMFQVIKTCFAPYHPFLHRPFPFLPD